MTTIIFQFVLGNSIYCVYSPFLSHWHIGWVTHNEASWFFHRRDNVRITVRTAHILLTSKANAYYREICSNQSCKHTPAPEKQLTGPHTAGHNLALHTHHQTNLCTQPLLKTDRLRLHWSLWRAWSHVHACKQTLIPTVHLLSIIPFLFNLHPPPPLNPRSNNMQTDRERENEDKTSGWC